MDHWSISTPELERYLRRTRQERSQMFAKLSRHAAVGLAQLVREAVTIAGDIGRSAWRRIVRGHLRRVLPSAILCGWTIGSSGISACGEATSTRWSTGS